MGPCLCGDPYCGSCGDPSLAVQEAFIENVLERMERSGAVSSDDWEKASDRLAALEIFDEHEQAFCLRITKDTCDWIKRWKESGMSFFDTQVVDIIWDAMYAFRKATGNDYKELQRLRYEAEYQLEKKLEDGAAEYLASRSLEA